jgi:hypothetical protein
MANNRDGKFDYSQFLKHGALRNLTWADFVERAKNYCPSERLLKSTKIRLVDLGAKPGESINLLEQFRDLLKGAIKDYRDRNGPDSRFKWALLAGGSSLWPFVKDGVKEILNVFDENILIDPDPYATIALGLAQIPYRRKVLADRKDKLEKLFSGNEGKISKIIDVCLDSLKSNFTRSCASDLDDSSIWSTIIKPIVLPHIKGKIGDKALKKQLEAKKDEIQEKMICAWEEESKKTLGYLRSRVQKELRSEADANYLTLSQRFQIDLSGALFEKIFDSLLPEESKISFFTGIANMLLKPYELFVSFLEKEDKRGEKEQKKLKEKQTRFKEEVENAVEEVFTKSYIRHKLLEQIKAPVKLAIDNIELLQSQV